VLEKRYVPRRSQRTRSVLTFFAEDAGTHTLLYANADVSKASQIREVITPEPPLGIGEGCRLPPCRDQVEPDRASPACPVSLVGGSVQGTQLLIWLARIFSSACVAARQARTGHGLARRVEVLPEVRRDGGAGVIEPSVPGDLRAFAVTFLTDTCTRSGCW
jgi:hypothetical protein